MSATPQLGGETDTSGDVRSRVGSQLLLRKFPLLAKARAYAQETPDDPRAECNLLCYGSDVYRIYSLTSAEMDGSGVIFSNPQKRQRTDDEPSNGDGGALLRSIDDRVALPTQLSFLTLLENELRKSETALRSAAQKSKTPEKETTDDNEKGKKAKNRDGTVSHSQKGGRDTAEGGEGKTTQNDSGVERGFPHHKEEDRLILEAIRKPLDGGMRSAGAHNNGSCGSEKAPGGDQNSSRGVAGSGKVEERLQWEIMAESIMSRSEVVAGTEGTGGDAVRSYLRRVAWIEQQKGRQSLTNSAAETAPHGEQLWSNMTEAARVQKEIMRMRAQRKQFHRERKKGE
ncbi:uncharacterized protein TEOVI_000211400 [Trypanosoma equiperdum]|uniref:Uncharacterized protein n=1 Tax=Trypanosoma equiperdum TaxID=5694 RepID=A0A1G4IDW6_TRYEQ|nr:hypothetical protein, conserved [Trypanosoma equiperdum]